MPHDFVELVRMHPHTAVMAAAFAEFLGIPVPSAVILLYAGAVASGEFALLVACAALAAVLADLVWFAVGRKGGERLLGLYCKVSLGSQQCTSRTKAIFGRYGLPSLLVAKFIPGYSTFAAPLAGHAGTSTLRFVLWDLGGAVLWGTLLVGVGVLIGEVHVASATQSLKEWGDVLFWGLVIAAVLYLIFKIARRARFGGADPSEIVDPSN